MAVPQTRIRPALPALMTASPDVAASWAFWNRSSFPRGQRPQALTAVLPSAHPVSPGLGLGGAERSPSVWAVPQAGVPGCPAGPGEGLWAPHVGSCFHRSRWEPAEEISPERLLRPCCPPRPSGLRGVAVLLLPVLFLVIALGL